MGCVARGIAVGLLGEGCPVWGTIRRFVPIAVLIDRVHDTIFLHAHLFLFVQRNKIVHSSGIPN